MSGIIQGVIASIGGAIADAYFNLVTLLLPGNGTNGAQNNTFVDSSTNNFTITRNGNTTQGTFSPFSQTGWSNYFDGVSGTYLTLSSNSAFDFGTGDFTVEGWFYLTPAAGLQTLYSLGVYNTNGILYRTDYFYIGGFTYTPSLPVNQWFHSAVTRSGTSLNVFVNGVSVASGTNSTSVSSASGLFIGTSAHASSSEQLRNAYVSNFRLLKGTALYTSNFTPPTAPLTAITNTSLLTCQSNRFVDNSTNAFAITVNGTPSVQAFSPFAPTAAYSAATVGGSGYFDGTGDYVSVADNAALNFGTGDLTVEGWVYMTALPASQFPIAGKFQPGSPFTGWELLVQNTGVPRIWFGTSYLITASSALSVGSWNHLAMVRSGSTVTLWVNGVSAGTATSSTNVDNTGTCFIGTEYNASNGLIGYLSSVRVLKGTAVYTSAFTPPTAPLTAITNTQLLCNFTNAGITDATAKNDLETVGNAQISTTQSKFGGSSIAFDGSGDYLTSNTATTDLYAFGSGDFTIECWVYFNSVSSLQIFYDARPTSTQGAYPCIYLMTDGTIRYFVSTADQITSSAVSANTWYHIAIARANGATRMFVNGVQAGSTYTDSNNYTCGVNRPAIGGSGFSPGSFSVNGYIDDLRITKGYARYTTNFTPPATAFPLQ